MLLTGIVWIVLRLGNVKNPFLIVIFVLLIMIISQLNNPARLLAEAALQIGASAENNRLILFGSAGEGSIIVYTIEEGLTMIIAEVNSNESISDPFQRAEQD